MLKSALTLILVAASSTLYAASDHSSTVLIDTDVRAGATSIPAGSYTLHWSADSGDTDLTITGFTITDQKQRFSIPITVKHNPLRENGNAAVVTRSDGGMKVLEEFKIKDKLLIVR